MTIPNVIHKYRAMVLQTQFKKAFSNLNQAHLYVLDEIGGGLKGVFAKYDRVAKRYTNANEITNAYYYKLKRQGKCTYKNKAKNYNNSTDKIYVDQGTAYPSVLLADGMCVEFRVISESLFWTVDINGIAGPNRLGHDIFFFQVDDNDGLVPLKTWAKLTPEQIEDYKNNRDADADTPNYSGQAGYPCSKDNTQQGNGIGCAWYALHNVNPDDEGKTYWDNLPK